MLIMVLNVSLCLIVIISVSSILTLTRNLLTVSFSLSYVKTVVVNGRYYECK